MKKFFILISLVISSFVLKAQWEYAYFVFDAGLIHNPVGPLRDSISNTFVTTPDGDYQLYTKTADNPNNYFPYALGYYVGLDFHYDMKSDATGIVFGAKYMVNSFKYHYVTLNPNYEINQQLYAYSLAIPFYIKFGEKLFKRRGQGIYKKQKYFFVGGQYNYHLFLKEVQTPSWETNSSTRWGSSAEITKGSNTFFIGMNYLTFRVQLDYTPNPFLNTAYKDANSINTYTSTKGKYLMIRTSFTLPLNEWLFLNSWAAEQIRRKFRFGGR